MNSWGLHLLIDAEGGSIPLVSSKENIRAFVEKLVDEIDMVAYGPLWIEHFATHDPEKAGISFCQMIETSNITGHFVDKNGNFYIDVFSCKEFEAEVVVNLVKEYFKTDDISFKMVERGVY